MAIIFDDKYYKIISSKANFKNNTTEIEMDVYGSKETREYEKKISIQANAVISNIHSKLEQNILELIEKTEKIKPINEITDAEEFYKKHPEIKIEQEKVESIQNEGLYLIDKLLKINIDFDNLKYKDYWCSLGLTKELCNAVDYKGTFQLSVNGIRNNELSNLYSSLKEKITSKIIDC